MTISQSAALSPTIGELEIYSKIDLASDLEEALAKGFDVATIAKAAYDIYQEQGLELTKPMGHTLLMLMAMEEGPEFELTETEFLDLISEIKAI